MKFNYNIIAQAHPAETLVAIFAFIILILIIIPFPLETPLHHAHHKHLHHVGLTLQLPLNPLL